MGFWRSRRRNCAMGGELVADVEAFLSGRLVEHIESRGDIVPAWAWTNLLAHGTIDDLRADCKSPWLRRARTYCQWRQARSHLAAEVLSSAKQYGSLAEVQRVALVPLELQLASRAEVAYWASARWATVVEVTLAERYHSGRGG